MASVSPDEVDTDDVKAFADHLVSCGKAGRAAIDRAMQWHRAQAESFPKTVTSLGLVSEPDMAALLSQFLGLDLLAPDDFPDALIGDLDVRPSFYRQAQLVPLAVADDHVCVAMADPFDRFARQALELKLGLPSTVKVAVPSDLENAIERYCADGGGSVSGIVEHLDSEEDAGVEDEERLKDLASEAPVIRLVNLLIKRAVEARASDIHIEPFQNRLRVRFRIDGVLRDTEAPPAGLRAAVLSRVKIMAKLNIAERRLPQDGRIKVVVQGKELDIRVSTVPTMHGESAVLRLLDTAGGVYQLQELGFRASDEETLSKLLSRPDGILLVTGPTGSGKTTTLYASLLRLNSIERKIITVEDPVEYQLEGINQIQVKPQIGLRFADVLRSILRQDPDVMMIGEIRDLETAQISVQASLTGHTVLSTLHTNSAASTITRLLDMGVEGYLLASTLSGVIAQRLVRKLCAVCKAPYRPPPEFLQSLGLVEEDHEKQATFHRPVGCQACGGTGYRGRACIAEILVIDAALQSRIITGADARSLADAAAENGMTSIYMDGLAKAAAGVTSLQEVLRVTRQA